MGKFYREGFGKFPRRVHIAEQNFRSGAAHSLSAEVRFQNALYLPYPGHFKRGTIAQNNDRIALKGADFFNIVILLINSQHK
jgi:hypothetical protein